MLEELTHELAVNRIVTMAKKNNGKVRNQTRKGLLEFSRINLAFGAGALATITLGYWLLSQGSISMAPILLVVGYVVLVPLAIIL